MWSVGSMLTERKPKYLEKYCLSFDFSNIKPKWIALRSHPGHHVEKPVSGA